MSEQWKPVLGWERWYEASNQGRIRSWHNNRSRHRSEKPRILRPGSTKHGHLHVSLSDHPRRRLGRVHRLVWEAFNGPIPDGLEMRHLNGDPSDNRLENLKPGTSQENYQDTVRHGKLYDPSGEANGKAKLTDDAVREIFALRSQGLAQQAIADRFGVSDGLVCLVLKRKIWRHVDIAAAKAEGWTA